MKWYKADLHVHSVLSPCGDLEMSPKNIVKSAKQKGVEILAITDHNSTKHCELIMKLGRQENISVVPGIEFNTAEEVHCIGLFEDLKKIAEIQQFVDAHAPLAKNDTKRFGEQVVVNEKEEIIEEVEYLLIDAMQVSVDAIEKKVHELGGVFIPAHIDRPYTSIVTQLGFIPKNLKVDAVEISYVIPAQQIMQRFAGFSYPKIRNSDAHLPEQIARASTRYQLEEPTFKGLKHIFENKLTERIAY